MDDLLYFETYYSLYKEGDFDCVQDYADEYELTNLEAQIIIQKGKANERAEKLNQQIAFKYTDKLKRKLRRENRGFVYTSELREKLTGRASA